MSEQEHTPAPWTIGRLFPAYHKDGGRTNDYPGAEIDFREAEEHKEFHSGAIQIWSHRAEADARLIAAAPRMFDRIALLAKGGDGEAVSIMEALRAGR